MNAEKVILKAPPRLLLGAAFLFWGWMTDNETLALACALLLEARHWFSLRWQFGENGFARAWQLCVLLLIVLAVAKLGAETDRVAAAVAVLINLPLVFLPLALAQQYSSDRGVPVTTFSFVARRRMRRDRAAGREVKLSYCRVGYPYLGILLATAGLDTDSARMYGMGVILLVSIAVFAMKEGKGRPWAAAISLALALVVSFGLVSGIRYLESQMNRAFRGDEVAGGRQVQTALGQVMKLQLSDRIDWRYRKLEGTTPPRLRLASYNVFALNRWLSRWPQGVRQAVPEERDVGGGITFLHRSGEGLHQDHAYLENDLLVEGRSRGLVMGQVADDVMIPIPTKSRRFVKVAAQSMDSNAFGTTRLGEPDQGSLALEVVIGERRAVDEDPAGRDMEIPESELEGTTRFWLEQEMEVAPWGDPDDRLPLFLPGQVKEEDQIPYWAKLQQVFTEDFRYTTDLKPRRGVPMIDDFLFRMKEGHCEYFGSAAALLLRRVGIPTRYVVGYVVTEKGKADEEYLLRGKHAHAWCQAYLGGEWVREKSSLKHLKGEKSYVWRCRGGRWVDIDLTPPDIFSDKTEGTALRKLRDWWQLVREDLVIWFTRPVVSAVMDVLIWVASVGLLLWIAWRLWSTRSGKVTSLGQGDWNERCSPEQALQRLERWLVKRFKRPVRPVAMPVDMWLLQEFPEVAQELVARYRVSRFDPQFGQVDLRPEVERFRKQMLEF